VGRNISSMEEALVVHSLCHDDGLSQVGNRRVTGSSQELGQSTSGVDYPTVECLTPLEQQVRVVMPMWLHLMIWSWLHHLKSQLTPGTFLERSPENTEYSSGSSPGISRHAIAAPQYVGPAWTIYRRLDRVVSDYCSLASS